MADDSPLAKRIRAAATIQGIGVDALRERTGLSPDTFYRLLRGEAPRTVRVIRKLKEAGVRIPRDLIAA